MNEPVTVNWTLPMFRRFKKAYNEAQLDLKPQFTFDGKEFVTDYARYLILFLELEFARTTP